MKQFKIPRIWPLLVSLAVLLHGCGGKRDEAVLAEASERLGKGDTAAAVIELKSLLQRTPNSAPARLLLASALLEQGDAKAAEVELNKAKDAGLSDEKLVPVLAQAWLSSGKSKDLIQTYGDATLVDPTAQRNLRVSVATAYAALGRRAEAEVVVADVLKSSPDHSGALVVKAKLQAYANNFDDALATADRVVQAGPNSEVQMLRGYLLRYAKKDLDAAAKAFEAAANDPRAVIAARAALVQVRLAQRKLPDAKSQLAELKKSHPKNPQTLFLDAVVSFADKDYGRAEAITTELLRYAPDNTQILVLGGAASLQRGALVPAEAKLGKVVQTVEGMVPARKMLSETYLRMGQAQKALHTLRPLLEAAKPDGDALALAGQAYLQVGELALAEESFAAATKLRPDDVQVRTALALADLVRGKAEAAIDALQVIAAKDPGETADLALIGALLRRGDADAALAAVDRLAKKQTGNVMAMQLRGLALLAKGDKGGARAAFDSVLKAEPKHMAAIVNLVNLDLQENKPERARQRLDDAIKADPKTNGARMALLDLMLRQDAKPEVRLALINEAINANASEAAPHIAKIAHLLANSDPKGAAAAAQQALAQIPDHLGLLDMAGRAFVVSGEPQQAISIFNKLASLSPQSALPQLRLADLHAQRGDNNAYRSSLGRAFDVEPRSKDVHSRLLALAKQTKDPKVALVPAKDLQRRFAGSALGWLLEGDAHAARKEWSAALIAYRGGLGKADAGARPQIKVYETAFTVNGAGEANRFAAEWLKSHAGDVSFMEYLGGSALLRRDFPVAEQYFREVLKLQPKNSAALNNLAWSLAERGGTGAVGYAEQALALSPGAAPIMDTLAKALATEGNMQRALEVQRKAISSMPGQASLRTNLVRLLIKSGSLSEAREELKAIEKLGRSQPLDLEIAELRRMLGN